MRSDSSTNCSANLRTASRPWALCLESPLRPEEDIGGKCFNIQRVKTAFANAYHVMVRTMREEETWAQQPNASVLCPFLVNPEKPPITGRRAILKRLPPALSREARLC